MSDELKMLAALDVALKTLDFYADPWPHMAVECYNPDESVPDFYSELSFGDRASLAVEEIQAILADARPASGEREGEADWTNWRRLHGWIYTCKSVHRRRPSQRGRDYGGEVMEWQPIETAPRDGTWIQVKIPGHGSDNIVAWQPGLLDSEGADCGDWTFMTEQEPPDDWTDGVCWAVNSDGLPSTRPTHWMPLPPPPTASHSNE